MYTNRVGEFTRTFAYSVAFVISYHRLSLFIKYLGRI